MYPGSLEPYEETRTLGKIVSENLYKSARYATEGERSSLAGMLRQRPQISGGNKF